MRNLISLRFKQPCKSIYYDPAGHNVRAGDLVVAETARGVEIGTCARAGESVDETKLTETPKTITRVATQTDRQVYEANLERAKAAVPVCQRKSDNLNLEMRVVDSEILFDGSKIVFYFTADGRVDFRQLVRDLAAEFRIRIELRQIGVRDEAKMLGGIGICGQAFCCSSFLDEFHPVSIKMAKEQNLSLNPVKISGACGRLMCCLKYEQEAYEELWEGMPPVESVVDTPDGRGRVTDVNLLRGTAKVQFPTDAPPAFYEKQKLKCIRCGDCRGGGSGGGHSDDDI